LPSERDESDCILSRFAPREGSSQPCVRCCNLRHSVGSFSIVAVCGHGRRFDEHQVQWTLTFEIATDRYRSILPKLEQGITGIGDPSDEKKNVAIRANPHPIRLEIPGKTARNRRPRAAQSRHQQTRRPPVQRGCPPRTNGADPRIGSRNDLRPACG
jgi:hypothetical protein